MKHITCYLDFISPYAYLAFEHLPTALAGTSYAMTYKPVLFAGLLKHHGQLGPAEIAPKRDWTYRQVLWLAQRHGIDLTLPKSHPFNPLGLLRLAVASDEQGLPNRYVTETIFRHVWCGGEEASDAARLAQLTAQLAPDRAPDSDAVKAQLKHHTEEAIAKGLFGVPLLRWMASCSGAWRPCPCCAIICSITRGLQAKIGLTQQALGTA
jgi:2-hydroxychromene-2-carboxylate isomerase